MHLEEMRNKAQELFMKRMHWSQAILAVGLEKAGIEMRGPLIKAMGAFGGGIASTGRVCGILIGGIATISALFSKANPEEEEDPRMWKLSYKLTKIFEDMASQYGSINCADIARVNWRDKEETFRFYNNRDSRRQICTRLVGDFVVELGKILEKEGLG